MELRRLERIYQQDPSSNNLLILNKQRVRYGIDPIRTDPHYLRQWALDIYTIAKSSDEYIPLGDWNPNTDGWGNRGAYEDGFTGQLPFYKNKETPILMINIEMYAGRGHTRATPEGEDSLVINMEPLHDALSWIRAWQVRAILSNESVSILIPRPAPHGWNLRMPYEESQRISNRFLSAQELLDYLMNMYRQEVKASWKKLLENTQPDKNQFINVLEVADVLRKKKWFFGHPAPLMKHVIEAAWFREALDAYADEAEADLRRQGLIFDLEQRWPIKAQFSGDQYILMLETGYNDTVDPEEFDESEPEGSRYGDVNQFMDQISRELEKVSGTEWDVEWKYAEEYEAGSDEIAIDVKAETSLSYEFLLHLLK